LSQKISLAEINDSHAAKRPLDFTDVTDSNTRLSYYYYYYLIRTRQHKIKHDTTKTLKQWAKN